MNIISAIYFKTVVIFFILALVTGCDYIERKSRPAGVIPLHLKNMSSSSCPLTFTVSGQKWNLDYLGFYLSEPEVRIDGKWQRVKFRQNDWQTPNVALLKFHNACDNAASSNTKIMLDATKELLGLASAFRFTLGLPFDVNHANPLTQPSPLNDSTMFWSWQAGHKFMRLDISASDNGENTFSYHLGSIGCESESAMRPPEKSCTFSNRVNFILPMNQLDTNLDLSLSVTTILAQASLNDSDGCIFDNPDEPACKQLMRNLVNRPWIAWE